MENMENQEEVHFSKIFTQESLDELYKQFATLIDSPLEKPIINCIFDWYVVPHKDAIIAKLKEHGFLLAPYEIAIFLQQHCLLVHFGRVGLEKRPLTREEKNWISGIEFWESSLDDEDADESFTLEKSIIEQRGLSEEFVTFSADQRIIDRYVEKYNEHFKPVVA